MNLFKRKIFRTVLAGLSYLFVLGNSSSHMNLGAEDSKKLIISSWFGPGPALNTADQLKLVAEAGFTVVGPRTWHPSQPFFSAEDYRKFLDNCRLAGIKGIMVSKLHMPIDSNSVDVDKLKSLLLDSTGSELALKDHPALSHYLVYDEPHRNKFESIKKFKDALSKVDPVHPMFVNLFPIYATPSQLGTESYHDYLTTFTDIVNPPMLSVDVYPFREDGLLASYFYNLDLVRKHAQLKGIDPWLSIQTWEGPGHKFPTEDQVRWQAFHGLAYGYKAIFYFTLYGGSAEEQAIMNWNGSKGILYESTKALNARLKEVGNILVNLEHKDVFHGGRELPYGANEIPEEFPIAVEPADAPITISTFEGKGGSRYFLLVNRSFDLSQEVSVTALESNMTVLFDESGAMGSSCRIKFSPGDGRLIRLGN